MPHTSDAKLQETRLNHEIKQVETTTCCIVGGGPAGAILALLLARQGVPVTLLEAHKDFDRDFRGDTIHPSVMDILDDIGLADRLLQLPHSELQRFVFQTPTGPVTVADLSRFKAKYPYVTVISQASFLDFISAEAQRYPSFRLVMGAQVDELVEENGVVRGVRYRGEDGWYELCATLTVGADGRFSRLRKLAGFEPVKTSPPMDILWFRLSRREGDLLESLGGRFGKGHIVALISRFEYWQLGYVIPKGRYQQVRAAGLEQLRSEIAEIVPELADRVSELQDWKQVSVLSVESNCLSRWYRPGLLLIGDAAHVMSPVGGVGINYAIQDAVATANILTEKLIAGTVTVDDLAAVQRRRKLPVRTIQRFQAVIQDNVLYKALKSPNGFTFPPLFLWLLKVPLLRRMPARLIGWGLRPERVRSR